MTPGKKQAFEPTGLIPRSIVRTFERFYKQLLPKTKYSAIREYRISRYQVLVSIRCLCTLLMLPLLTRIVTSWLIFPQIQYFWDVTYQEEHVFTEIDQFSQVLFFDSLLAPFPLTSGEAPGEASGETHTVNDHKGLQKKGAFSIKSSKMDANFSAKGITEGITTEYKPAAQEMQNLAYYKTQENKALQEKIFSLAESSHSHALQSLTNVFADLFSIIVLIFLLITLKPEITILKSFLIEVIYNLSDTTKSFLLILMTDLLVGFHSPRGWETMFSLILNHFGLPENQDFVFLFVATLPVILDTVFKYWIFRHLNKISPSTVATYHNMIE